MLITPLSFAPTEVAAQAALRNLRIVSLPVKTDSYRCLRLPLYSLWFKLSRDSQQAD